MAHFTRPVPPRPDARRLQAVTQLRYGIAITQAAAPVTKRLKLLLGVGR